MIKSKLKIIFLIAFLIIVFSGCAFLPDDSIKYERPEIMERDISQYKTSTLQKKVVLDNSLIYFGQVEYKNFQSIYVPQRTTFSWININVEKGQKLKKGDLLYEHVVKTSSDEVEKIKNDYEYLTLKYNEAIKQNKSNDEVKQSWIEMEEKRLEYESLLDSEQNQYTKKFYAPYDCEIIWALEDKNILYMTKRTKILEIASSSELNEITTTNNNSLYEEGKILDAVIYDGTNRFSAKFEVIENSGKYMMNESKLNLSSATIRLVESEKPLKQGQQINIINNQGDEQESVLCVPTSAVYITGEKAFFRIIRDGKVLDVYFDFKITTSLPFADYFNIIIKNPTIEVYEGDAVIVREIKTGGENEIQG